MREERTRKNEGENYRERKREVGRNIYRERMREESLLQMKCIRGRFVKAG